MTGQISVSICADVNLGKVNALPRREMLGTTVARERCYLFVTLLRYRGSCSIKNFLLNFFVVERCVEMIVQSFSYFK